MLAFPAKMHILLDDTMNHKLPIASFIHQIERSIPDYEIIPPDDETESLYRDFPQEHRYMFAKLHENLIFMLSGLNEKIDRFDFNYTPDEVQRFKATIEATFKIEERFNADGFFPFQIIPLYKEHLQKCLEYLSSSCRSDLPPELEEIPLYTRDPIFEKLDTSNLPSAHERVKAGLKNIGNGGYAHVYSFKDSFLNKKLVLKRARRELTAKELMRFKTEFETLRKLSSPYIVEVYTYNEEKHEYIMEAMDDSLTRYIETHNNSIGLEERRKICAQIFKGLKYIHQEGYLHRDVHANNVLIRQYHDDTLVVKLADFGLAKIPDSELTSTLTSMKGAVYNDPDLLRDGFANYALPHEIYALCSLIYFVLTGKKVYSKDWDIHKVKNQRLHDFIEKGLSPNIAERFHDVDEVAHATNEVIKSMGEG